MESIDSLAKMINHFKGGLVLVSHDMRLISQVAKEIWICDKKKVEKVSRRHFEVQVGREEGAAEEARPARERRSVGLGGGGWGDCLLSKSIIMTPLGARSSRGADAGGRRHKFSSPD